MLTPSNPTLRHRVRGTYLPRTCSSMTCILAYLHTYLLAHLLEEDASLLIEKGLHRGEALREDELICHHHLHHEGVVRLRGGG